MVERYDLTVDASRFRRFSYLFQRGIGPAECDIVSDGSSDQLRILQDEADCAIQFFGCDIAHVDASDADGSLGWIVESGDQRGQRGFARAGRSDQRGHGAFRNGQADIIQRLGCAIRVVDMVDAHIVSVRMLGMLRFGQRRDLQILFDAQRRRAGQLVAPLHVADGGDGAGKHHGGQSRRQHLRCPTRIRPVQAACLR